MNLDSSQASHMASPTTRGWYPFRGSKTTPQTQPAEPVEKHKMQMMADRIDGAANDHLSEYGATFLNLLALLS